jgi:hypothetical protein
VTKMVLRLNRELFDEPEGIHTRKEKVWLRASPASSASALREYCYGM